MQAFVAGEVNPARRAAYEAHLESCGACRERRDRVQGIHQLLSAVVPVDLDELAWRRVQTKVRSQLQDEVRDAPSTLDLVLGRRWWTAGLVAAAAVALLVWFAPVLRPKPSEPQPQTTTQLAVRRVHARQAPVDLVLSAGVELELGAQGRLEVLPVENFAPKLVLVSGALRVRDFRPPALGRPIRLQAAPYTVEAQRSDFVITTLADGAQVEVHRGTVQVTPPGGPSVTVAEGTARRFVTKRAEVEPEVAKAPAPRAAVRRSARAEAPVDPPVSVEIPVPVPVRAAPVPAPVPAPPETRVEVEPPRDPRARLLLQAEHAYYRDHDLERAIELSLQVRARGPKGPAYWAATELLCQAYTANSQADLAVQTCSEQLQRPMQDASRRKLHQQLAEIHRTQRGDCESAIKHFNQVLVFGRTTPLDDNARLLRAGCALKVGDLTLAERDLAQLEASTTFRRQSALLRLRDELSASRQAQVRNGATDNR